MCIAFSPEIEENHVRNCFARVQSSLNIKLSDCSSFLAYLFIPSLQFWKIVHNNHLHQIFCGVELSVTHTTKDGVQMGNNFIMMGNKY